MKRNIITSSRLRPSGRTALLVCVAFTLLFSASAWGQTGNTMQNPIVVATPATGIQYVNSQNTAGFTNSYTGRPSNDVFYKFTLSTSMNVEICHCGSTLSDTYLHLLDAWGYSVASNDDYYGEGKCSSTYHSYLQIDLTPGTYYVVSEGYSQNGVIQTSIKTGSPRNFRSRPIDAGTLGVGSSYVHSQNTESLTNTYAGRPTKEVFYKFTLPTSMNVEMSHCGSTLGDTYLHLLDASGNRIDYNDDYSGEGKCSNTYHSYLQKALTAGTYYVVSEGYSQNGVIQTSIKTSLPGNSFNGPINAGTFSSGFVYTNSQNIANFTNTYTGRPTNDIFYKFTLTKGMNVTISHCGSAVDSYLHLLDASGNRIDYNDDYYGEGACSNTFHSFLRKDLAAGTYYVVSESYSALSGVIQTTIMTSTGESMQTPINAGTFSAGFQYTDSQSLENFTNCYAGRSTNDIFYKFTLTKSMNVVINHCGSTVDTYLHLLDASGNRIDYNDDYRDDGSCSNALHSFLRKDLAAGTYYVVSESFSALSGQVQTTIVGLEHESEFGYPNMPDAYSADLAAVGTVAGALDVSATGAATYTIPIEVPLGVGGMQPSLAIAYNSQLGNGVAGWGCNLAGVSAITRAPKSIYYDGTAKGLTYLGDEAYMLDGQRLILYSGTAGQDNAVYCPEADPFTRVTMRGSCTSTACSAWFEVLSKDGVKYRYGSTAGAQQTYTKGGVSKINAWYLDRVEDALGNYMAYSYLKSSSMVYLSSISYGNNVNESAAAIANLLTLTYESRPDNTPFKLENVSGSISLRLSKITSRTNGSIFREYALGYTNTDHFSRLTAITEKNGAGEALHPIQLGWSYLPSYSQTYKTPAVSAPTAGGSSVGFDTQAYSAADFNGDGLTDMAGMFQKDGYTYVSLYYASPDATNIVKFTPGYLRNLGYAATPIGGCTPIDANGDGINEMVVALKNGNNTVRFWFFGPSFAPCNNDFIFSLQLDRSDPVLYATGDFNNDGKGDIFVVDKEKFTKTLNRHHCAIANFDGSMFVETSFILTLPGDEQPEKLFAADFNGDGLTDVMLVYSGGYTIFWNQGGGITSSTLSDSKETSGTAVANCSRIYPGDFNGDGLQDFIMSATGSSSWYFALNNGDGTFSKTLAYTLGMYDQSFTSRDDDKFSCLVYDFDFDGKSDVIIQKAMYTASGAFSQTYTYWMRSTGTALSQVFSAASASESDAYSRFYVAGDFDGDGQPELMNYGYNCYNAASTSRVWRLYKSSSYGAASGKLTGITDGYGELTSIAYDKLAGSSGTYVKGSGSQYPVADVTPPLTVVKTVTTGNGVAGSMQVSYKYTGAKLHRQGKGFLGFTSRTAGNATLGVTVESGVTIWNTTYYVPSKSYEKTTVDGKTAETTVSYIFVNKGGKKYFAYPSTKTEKDLDANASTTYYTFDANGNLTEEQTQYGSSSMYTATQYGSYVTTGGGTVPSKPQLITSIQKHADDAGAFTRKTYITYNTAKGYPTQKIENYGTALALTTTYTSYNTVGNPTSWSVSGAGVPTLIHYRDYDATRRFVAREYSYPTTTVHSYAYDTWGNLTSETDETNYSNKLTTTHTYNKWGQRTSTTYPDGRRAAYARGWKNGNSAKRYFTLTQETGQPWVKTWYDKAGRETLVETVGPKGMSISTANTYNSKGQLTQTENRQGSLTLTESYAYDDRGRITASACDTWLRRTTYSYANRQVTTTRHTNTALNNDGRTYTKTYDAWGNVKSSGDPVSSVAYTYTSNGKPKTITAGGVTTSMTYDAAGNQKTLTDPDAGTTTYTCDALGRVTAQVDARGKQSVTEYAAIERMLYNTVDGVRTSYTYGSSGYNMQRLTGMETGSSYVRYAYDYDRYGRLSLETRYVAPDETLNFTYAYTPQGQLKSITYPGGVQVTQEYDAYGYHVKTLAGTQTVWELTGETGLTTTAQLGGGAMTATTTRNSKGWLAGLKTVKGSAAIRDLGYVFDGATDNLISRTGMLAQKEAFYYDGSNRLTTVQHGTPAVTAMSVSYAANGNISSKTGVGQYAYLPGKPHAVEYVDNTDGLISGNDQSIAYTAFGKVSSITEMVGADSYGLEFTYGPDRQRWKTVLKKNGVAQKTAIFAGDYEKITEGTVTRQLYYLRGADGLAAVYVKQAGQADKIYYAHTDHLGSIVKLTDANGTEVFKASYDAWGKQTVSNNTFNFHRGYTGHEHLPEFGLVNMNGRMYDPILGRMLSPDPYVADPDFSQDFNRYSYARNNPLVYTDPDGEWIIGAAILVVFTYLKTAHDQTPADKNDGNPANWAWNPIDWFKKSDDPSAPPSPAVTISIGYTPGGGVAVGGGIGNPAGPMPMFGYSAGGGPSIGIYNNGLTSWYSSSHNPSAPEQNANRAIESTRDAYREFVIEVNRIAESPDATLSTFTAYGLTSQQPVNGYMLEPGGPSTTKRGQDRRIPAGVYNVIPHSSARFPNTYNIYGAQVSPDRGILIHSGNYHSETEGCFLPGSTYGMKDGNYKVGESRDKLNELRRLLGKKSVTMDIRDINY